MGYFQRVLTGFNVFFWVLLVFSWVLLGCNPGTLSNYLVLLGLPSLTNPVKNKSGFAGLLWVIPSFYRVLISIRTNIDLNLEPSLIRLALARIVPLPCDFFRVFPG